MFLFKKVILGLSFLLTVSCSKKEERLDSHLNSWMREQNKIKILSTTTQIGDLASEIGGERVHCLVLIEGGLDPHSYELVKGDDEKLARADLIFYSGLGLEHGASLSAALRGSERSVAIADRIAAFAPELILKRGNAIDPHLWMDISLWKRGIDPVVEALSRIDPEGADYYRQRGKNLESQMEAVHIELIETMKQIPQEKRYLVTSHDAFQYFARSYLAGSAAPEGLSPDGQLSPADIRRIIEFLKEHQVTVLFPESNVSQDSIAKIASAGREMGLEIKICSEPLYGDASGGLSYLDMMKKNGETISRNLK